MAAPHSVDPAQLAEQLACASPDVLREMITAMANALMSAQADQVCGAEYGERSPQRTNRRNGYRAREWDTRAGTVEFAVPKLRQGSFFPDWLLTHRRRAEQALVTVVATAYLLGVSTRRVERLAEQLGIKSLSRSQVSEMATHLDAQVSAFRYRPLDAGPYTFCWVDALTVKVREDGRVVNVHALIATGVNADGHREILGLDVASGEDGAGWLAFLMRSGRPRPVRVQLVISDAHPELVAAIGTAPPCPSAAALMAALIVASSRSRSSSAGPAARSTTLCTIPTPTRIRQRPLARIWGYVPHAPHVQGRDAEDDQLLLEGTMTITAGFTGTVLRSRWPEVAIPPMSLPQFLLAAAADRGDRPALIDGLTGRVTSYGQFAALVDRVAAGFAAHGLRKGQVVAILAPNCPDWLITAYGAMTAGGVVTGINPLYTPAEVAGQLSGSGARFLVTVPAFLSTARAAIQQAGGAIEIVVLDEPAAGAIAFAELLAHGDTPPDVTIDPAVDLALLPFSSGTSGLPKGVQLTHRACVANVLQQRAAFCYATTDRVLAVAPFFHAVGFAVIANAALHAGAAVVTMPRFEIETFLRLVEHHRITATVVVPPIVLALAKHPAVDRYDLSSLEWIGCGAAPLDAALQQACARRLGRPGRAGLRDDRADRGRGAVAAGHARHTGRRRVAAARRAGADRPPDHGIGSRAGRDGRAVAAQPGGDGRLPATTPRRPRPPSTPTAGCTPATSPASTRTARCSSSTGSRS